MPDQTLQSLDARQLKLFENARRALERGDVDYALTACAEILANLPGCLPVRRLERKARQKKCARQSRWWHKTWSEITAWRILLFKGEGTPEQQLRHAELLLAKHANSIMGLRLLGSAAQAFDWPETTAFAFEAIREIEPKNRANLLALGEAWLTAQNPDAALRVSDEILALNPADGEGLALMRKASIARTTKQGRWDNSGDFREKLRDANR